MTCADTITNKRDYIAFQREYIKAIKSFLNVKMEVYSMTMPKITIYPDGKREFDYDFTDEQKETLRLADEGIRQVQESMGIAPTR